MAQQVFRRPQLSSHLRVRFPGNITVCTTGTNTGAIQVVGRELELRKVKHVSIVVKENRTYDQVFGDLGHGNAIRALYQQCTIRWLG